ncbi:MAG: hypothetical protein LBN43_04195 [Oscillospiraceae bacterium]|nr:hypothetical protein [Oscillospiraceae bacterium]
MKTYVIRYWTGGATIRYVRYKARTSEEAAAKFHRYRVGDILGIDEEE